MKEPYYTAKVCENGHVAGPGSAAVPILDTSVPASAEKEVRSCLRDLGRLAREIPHSPAVLAPGALTLSFGDLHERVEGISAALRTFGIGSGHIVAISMPQGPELLTALLGAIGITAVAPLDWNLTESEFHTRLSLMPGCCLWLKAGMNSPAVIIAARLGIPVIEAHYAADGGIFFSALGRRFSTRRSVPDDTALILQTSATTGAPKLVPLTLANLDAICKGTQHGLAVTSQDRYLGLMPLHHVLGFSCAVAQLLAGGSVVCTGGFDPTAFLSWLADFQPSWYTAGPTLHRAILTFARQHREEFRRTSLRFVRSGSGGASPTLLSELEEVLHVTVINGYGLTEAGPVTNTPPDRPRKPSSVGRTCGPEVAILDAAGNLLPPEAEGEVVMRGAAVTPGYLNDGITNQEIFRDGWFHTGDLGRLDTDGELFITGRIKEIINRGGETIAPLEIDYALMDHTAVAQAAAFPVPHSTLGEDVAAAVVLRPGESVTATELRSFLSARMARAKVPSRILFVDTIPASSSGKPLRKALSEKLVESDGRRGEQHTVQSSRALAPVEKAIAGIWDKILPSGTSSPDDDFFALGGDSLSATCMLTLAEREFGLDDHLWRRTEFFDSPTVATLARVVAECLSEKT